MEAKNVDPQQVRDFTDTSAKLEQLSIRTIL